MISIHIKIPSNNGKWHTKKFSFSDRLSGNSVILNFDDIIANLRIARGWEVKVGYNLLREIHANPATV